ncbi:MAG: DUF2723 domain-containing protein [Candidatus Kerfeldbacteria bacterium]|nr:DUF2723 domain-containing protein [Candidatus Kerfeldbacteria bacterium]
MKLNIKISWPIWLLTVSYWGLTLPFMSRLPYNWDAAQFVLALRHYDISMHQPHPPGYPLFVVLGKLLSLVFTENTALVVVAALLGFVSVLVLYLFCYRLWSNKLGSSLIAIGYLLNPLFWLYRETALSYTADAAASIIMGYVVWQTMTNRFRHYVLISSVVLAVAGAIRPSLVLLLLPLFIFQLSFHRRNWKLILMALGIVVVGTLAWLMPVMWLTGGVGEYLTHSRNLYSTAAASINIGAQTKLLFNTLLVSLNIILIPMVAGVVLLVIRYRLYWRTFIHVYLYAVVWLLPAVLVYSFGHFGQLGYALILVPPCYLLLIPVMQSSLDKWILRWLGALGLALISLIFLVLTPGYAHPNFFPHTRAELYLQHLARITPNLFKLNRVAIKQNDTKLTSIMAAMTAYPPSQTVIVTGRDLLYPSPANGLLIRNDELLRELSAMLPDYTVVEVAPGRDYFLQAYANQMETTYQRTITLPNELHYVVFMLDYFPSDQLPDQLMTTALPLSGTDAFYQLGIMDQPWEFAGFTFQREADKLVP